MTFEIGKYQVELINELDYDPGSEDNSSDYEKKYFTVSDYILPTKFGIKILERGKKLNSAIIGAEGGATRLHETSQIIENNRILICCGDTVFCLDLPTLDLNWKTKTDTFTSFEIFKINNGYIIHGELEITRIDKNGGIVWKNAGADIFVTPDGKDDFEIRGNFIRAMDWEHRTYKWDLNGIEIE